MLILALDTTTRAGSCALARDGRVVREQASDPGQPPAARLPADLMALLDAAGVALDAIDLFAVATGPGSFTGLRIGIATMQGLAFARSKPLIGISGLDALAAIATSAEIPSVRSGASALPPTTDHRPPTIVTWVDAWRGEVYAARYEAGREVEAPIVAPPAQLLARITTPALFIGDGAAAYRDEIARALGDRGQLAEPLTPLLAGAIARLADAAAAAGHLPAADAIRPLYVRRPDAELARDRA
ncbi:MAG: tRNA (adenosine(37)-N6)-threonylcarbamoyltransferase complex dimerization subunit type 1 TsaB [Vicinamibacterales bacterium]